jgi:trimeric autotransporter adhesin
MATYVNDLRLTELATGEGSGTWGTTTNTSLELIGEALGYATQQAFGSDADATTTVADGASDPARAMYYKITSAASLTATRTLTIAPNTISRVMFIENATSGSQSIAISQGSGASVTILTGKTAVVYLDGAGATAAVVDAMAGVDPGVTDTLTEVLVAGNTSGGTNIELSTTDKVQFRDAAIYLNSSVDGQLDIVADTEIQIAATTVDLNGDLDVSGTTLVTGVLTTTAATVFNGGFASNADSTLGTDKKVQFRDSAIYINSSVDGQLDIVADTEIQIAATTVDLNGNLDVSGTALVTGVLTTTAATVFNGGFASNADSTLGTDKKVQFRDSAIYINSSADGQLDIVADTEIQIAATTIDINGAINASGEIIATSLDISGDIDVDGTSNLDILDVDGAANFAADVTLADGADLITASAGTSNLRLGVNAGNSIESGGNYNVVVGDEAGTAITTGDQNVAIGFEALSTATTASRNTAVGLQALKVNTGDDNSAFGYGALILNTTGTYNTAIGRNAGGAVTTGIDNTLIGGLAGDALTDADYNVAIGRSALTSDTLGSRSVAVGYQALAFQNFTSATDTYNTAVGHLAGNQVTTGIQNTLIGGLAGDALTDADYNIAVGVSALSTDTLGSRSVAVGHSALATQNFTSATDVYNTAVGHGAGYQITTGTQNTLIGGLAGDAITTASYNTAVGYGSLTANTTGADNTAVGRTALENNTTASSNTAVGKAALAQNTTGAQNTSLGSLALNLNTTASNNTAVGFQSLFTNTTGGENTAVGTYALYPNTTGASNVAMGYNALGANTTASNNTSVGFRALQANTEGTQNVAIGSSAGDAMTTANNNVTVGHNSMGANTTGSSNVAVGAFALDANTTAGGNTALGNNTLGSNTTGASNTAVGSLALDANTTASNNTAVGYDALGANTTGSGNTAFGKQAGDTITTGTGNTIIGFLSDVGGGAAVNRIALGNQVIVSSDDRITVGAGSDIASLELNGSDTSWAASSDERLKENVSSSTAGLSFINDLRPVTYNWKKAKDVPSDLPQHVDGSEAPCLGKTYGTQLHGFIAQEVKTVLDNHPEVKDGQSVWQTDETTVQTLAPAALVPMLVKAIQELSAQNAALTARIEALES